MIRLRATRVAATVSLVLTGLVAGNFLAVQLGQVRVQNTMNARDFTLVKHSFEVAMGTVMPPLTIVTVLSLVPVLILIGRVRSWPFALVGVCLLLWIAATVVTLVFNAPVNAEAATWNPDQPPADWERLRDQWHTGHTIRTVLTVPAFALLAAVTTGYSATGSSAPSSAATSSSQAS